MGNKLKAYCRYASKPNEGRRGSPFRDFLQGSPTSDVIFKITKCHNFFFYLVSVKFGKVCCTKVFTFVSFLIVLVFVCFPPIGTILGKKDSIFWKKEIKRVGNRQSENFCATYFPNSTRTKLKKSCDILKTTSEVGDFAENPEKWHHL